jgi:hypothetical protein
VGGGGDQDDPAVLAHGQVVDQAAKRREEFPVLGISGSIVVILYKHVFFVRYA